MNLADTYRAEVSVWMDDSDGVPREYVPVSRHDRIVRHYSDKLEDTVAFARAHGLTDEMWEEWKAR